MRKIIVSITVDNELLEKINKMSRAEKKNRSVFISDVVKRYIGDIESREKEKSFHNDITY